MFLHHPVHGSHADQRRHQKEEYRKYIGDCRHDIGIAFIADITHIGISGKRIAVRFLKVRKLGSGVVNLLLGVRHFRFKLGLCVAVLCFGVCKLRFSVLQFRAAFLQIRLGFDDILPGLGQLLSAVDKLGFSLLQLHPGLLKFDFSVLQLGSGIGNFRLCRLQLRFRFHQNLFVVLNYRAGIRNLVFALLKLPLVGLDFRKACANLPKAVFELGFAGLKLGLVSGNLGFPLGNLLQTFFTCR